MADKNDHSRDNQAKVRDRQDQDSTTKKQQGHDQQNNKTNNVKEFIT